MYVTLPIKSIPSPVRTYTKRPAQVTRAALELSAVQRNELRECAEAPQSSVDVSSASIMSADNVTAADGANDTAVAEEDPLSILQRNTDGFFLVINAFIIFFMQCGFAFLEAGSVRYNLDRYVSADV